MNIELMISLNFIAISELAFLIFFIKSNVAFSKRRNQFFIIAAIINILLIATDVFQYYVSFQSFSNQHFWNTVSIAACYILNPVLPYVLIFLLTDKKKYIFPTIIICVNFITSLVFTSLYFTSFNHSYMAFAARGTGIFSLVIFGYSTVLLIKNQLKSKDEKIFMIIIVIVISSSYITEVLLRYRFLLWSSCAMCLVLFYMQLHTKMLKEDKLTGFYNRYVFEKDIHSVLVNVGLPIVEFDVNGLKMTNDYYGHAAGDELIVGVTEAIKKSFRNGKCYRIGGDEFVFIGNVMQEEELMKVFLNFNEVVGEKKVSYGYCFTTESIDTLMALKKADKMMYERKSIIKEQLSHED